MASLIPFLGLLLSIAVLPALAPRFWHRHMTLVAAFWTLALLLPRAWFQGDALHAAWHVLLLDYLPFVTLLLALYTVGGGILLEGGPWGTPAGNTLLLAIGTLLAGVVGTTGVSMVLIHPFLRANAHRRRRVHLVVFFIVLCANAGGITTPLGNPPLYLGFLHGVPFFWPLQALTVSLLIVAVPLLGVFWVLDTRLAEAPAPVPRRLRLRGQWNVLLLALVVAAVLGQGFWRPGDVSLFGVTTGLERLAGVAIFLAVTAASLLTTPRAVRDGNLFTWSPMLEVGVLFAALFVTVEPASGVLEAASHRFGQPGPLVSFWATGVLSAVLDSAPAYLVFFGLSGGEPGVTLQAISAGAVFFGALTYVGNAPNLMVRAIAAHRGIRMPGFFGYMGWASLMLLPGLVALSLLFFR